MRLANPTAAALWFATKACLRILQYETRVRKPEGKPASIRHIYTREEERKAS